MKQRAVKDYIKQKIGQACNKNNVSFESDILLQRFRTFQNRFKFDQNLKVEVSNNPNNKLPTH